MVDGEDDMEIMDGQDPFLLRFQPLRFLKCAAQRAMAILAGFIVKFQSLANGACLHHPAHGRRATIDDRADGFGLFIRKPMRLFILTNMLTEDASHIVAQRILWILHP